MKPTKIWTTELTNGIFGGLTPIIDPFDKSKFYISDGLGASYPSMKLRLLSFENGSELNAVSIKNSVRCIYFNSDKETIFAVSDNKLFQINRSDFSIRNKFDKGIQKYGDFISSNDKDTLLIMNFNTNFLFIYNYETGKSNKKKLETCSAICKENDDTFLIFCPKIGSIQRFDLKTNKVVEILKTETFYKSFKSNSNKFYLHLGKIIAATSNTHEKIEPTNQIEIYDSSNLPNKEVLKFDFHFDKFIVSENEELIYLIHLNKICIYSLIKQEIVTEIILDEKERIIQLFDDKKLFLSYEFDKTNNLTCWKY
jgi:hypothetical protein